MFGERLMRIFARIKIYNREEAINHSYYAISVNDLEMKNSKQNTVTQQFNEASLIASIVYTK